MNFWKDDVYFNDNINEVVKEVVRGINNIITEVLESYFHYNKSVTKICMHEMFQRVLLKFEYSTKFTRNIHRPWGKNKSIKD